MNNQISLSLSLTHTIKTVPVCEQNRPRCDAILTQNVMGPTPMQLVVVRAVRKAVSAATIIFATSSITLFLSMCFQGIRLLTCLLTLRRSHRPERHCLQSLLQSHCLQSLLQSHCPQSRRSGCRPHHHHFRRPAPDPPRCPGLSW